MIHLKISCNNTNKFKYNNANAKIREIGELFDVTPAYFSIAPHFAYWALGLSSMTIDISIFSNDLE